MPLDRWAVLRQHYAIQNAPIEEVERRIAQEELLQSITDEIVAQHGLTALHGSRDCSVWQASTELCGACGQPYTWIGFSGLHAGDPRIAIFAERWKERKDT